MKTWTTALRALLLTSALACAFGGASAFADDKKPYPKGAGAETPSASASAPPPEKAAQIVDGHKPWAPTLDVALPTTESAAPTKEEWASAPPAWEVRITDPGCKAQRVREWYRLTCKYTEVEMVSGSVAGVSFGCFKESKDAILCNEGSIIFPARRGDRRAAQFFTFAKWGIQPDSILTEQFLEGDPYPMISLQGLHWGF